MTVLHVLLVDIRGFSTSQLEAVMFESYVYPALAL